MNRTNSQFGFAMSLEDLSEEVLQTITYHEAYGKRIGDLYAKAGGDLPGLKALLNQMAEELLYNLSNEALELTPLQRSVTQLLLIQIGDVKQHGIVAHANDLVRHLRIEAMHPMSAGDRKVVAFLKAQADGEKARLDSIISEKKRSLMESLGSAHASRLRNSGAEGSGAGGSGVEGSGVGGSGAGQTGDKEGFWKKLGRKIKKAFGGGKGKGGNKK